MALESLSRTVHGGDQTPVTATCSWVEHVCGVMRLNLSQSLGAFRDVGSPRTLPQRPSPREELQAVPLKLLEEQMEEEASVERHGQFSCWRQSTERTV